MDTVAFYVSSVLLGVGLAMDAFSVSIANGLHDNSMKAKRMCLIAGTFAFFQFAMPMIGWLCVHYIFEWFNGFRYAIPWIALLLLGYIGGKMIYGYFAERKKKDAVEKNNEQENAFEKMTFSMLIVQGIATSIDALSVGFDTYSYEWYAALVSAAIIAVVTFVICIFGCVIGKKFGEKFSNVAQLFGGLILVGIGIEIFISNMITLFA